MRKDKVKDFTNYENEHKYKNKLRENYGRSNNY
jgi:hypothetical protein